MKPVNHIQLSSGPNCDCLLHRNSPAVRTPNSVCPTSVPPTSCSISLLDSQSSPFRESSVDISFLLPLGTTCSVRSERTLASSDCARPLHLSRRKGRSISTGIRKQRSQPIVTTGVRPHAGQLWSIPHAPIDVQHPSPAFQRTPAHSSLVDGAGNLSPTISADANPSESEDDPTGNLNVQLRTIFPTTARPAPAR